MIHQRYELSSDTLDLCKGKLVPGIAATWGEVTGNIENQKDLVSYISAHGGKAEWGSISGNLSDQTDLMGYMDRFATTAWVSDQNYLTSASLAGYATQTWVSEQGYYKFGSLDTPVSTHDYVNDPSFSIPSGYPGFDDFPGRYIETTGDDPYYIGGFERDEILGQETLGFNGIRITPLEMAWVTCVPVEEEGELTYWEYETRMMTEDDVNSILGSYATRSWVSSKGYLTASSLSGYIHFDESSPLSGIGKTLPFYGSTVGLFPVYQSFSSTWVNIEMTTNEIGWVSMGLACYDENGSSEIWRNRFITENDMTGYVSRSYVDWSVQTQGYPFSVYTPADASGNYILGSLNDTTQAFTGIKVSGGQAGAYIVTSSGLQYQESFDPFATRDWVWDWVYKNEDILKFTDKGVDYEVINRPDVNPDPDGYNSGGYILSLSEEYDTIEEDGDNIRRKFVKYLLCEDQTIFQKQFEYHEVDGEWELQNELEFQPAWTGSGWDIGSIHILPDDPYYQGRVEDFPVEAYFDIGWDKLPFGQLEDDGETLSFNGFSWDKEDKKLGLYKVTPIIVPGVGPDGYDEEFKAFALDDDLTTLASRVTSLETNYGDAVTITNNILGV